LNIPHISLCIADIPQFAWSGTYLAGSFVHAVNRDTITQERFSGIRQGFRFTQQLLSGPGGSDKGAEQRDK
jgi:hypothetical protein